jgi:glycosyltransferase involved in cell wall biosynthesis
LKILFLANGFPPDRWAGTETYTAGIAKKLQKRGHHVQVLCAGRWQEGLKYWNGYDDDVHHGIPVRGLNLNWKKATDPFRYLYDNPLVEDFLVWWVIWMNTSLI